MNGDIFKDYSNLKCSYLKDFILFSTRENKMKFLQNKEVRKKFLEDENHYEFVWLIQGLKNDELCYFVDQNFINEILNNNRAIDKINAIMTIDNKYKNIVLNNEEVCKLVCSTDLATYIGELSFPFLETMFYHILNEDGIKYLLHRFKDDELYEIFSKKENLEMFKEKCKNYIKYLPIEKLQELFSENEYVDDFLELDVSFINELISKGLKLSRNIYTNESFFKKYLEVYNVELLREYLENLSRNNIYAYELLDKLVASKYDKEVMNIDENGISDIYRNVENSERTAVRKTQERFLNVLIDKNFSDLTNNVLINLETIINFNEKTKIISSERISIYKKIINFYDLDLNEKKELYFILNKKYRGYLYDDFRNCQDLSYDMLNESLINLNNLKNKKIDGVNVYELKGEKFYICAHATSIKRKQIDENTIVWRKNFENDTLSISVINNNLLRTYKDPRKYLIFGYKRLDKENIMHMYHSDSYTAHSSGTQRINEIMTPEDLINQTKGYNEILISEKKAFNPHYIICYDEILEQDIKISKKMNIPIVVIYTQFYKEAINNISAIEMGFDYLPKYKKL